MIRPTAGCSSIVRICEVPDGCRFLCNAEYLLSAGLSTSPSRRPFHHRIIGMGSNNEFDWEKSLVALFDGAARLSSNAAHRIGWLTSMDCTLTIGPGKRRWNVPASLREAPIGQSGVSLCANGKKTADFLIAPGGLKKFQLRTEQTWSKPVTADQPLVRFRAHPDALAAAERSGSGTEHHALSMAPKPSLSSQAAPVAGPRWFDALTILKMDIEGFEWNYIPTWLQDELRSIGTNAHGAVTQGSTDPIDFEAAVPKYFSVSLMSLEFHRIGHAKLYGASLEGALRAHWLMLHTYALGFVMVAHEKNEMDQCCFEHAYVHVRHFVKSEMWMTLHDDL